MYKMKKNNFLKHISIASFNSSMMIGIIAMLLMIALQGIGVQAAEPAKEYKTQYGYSSVKSWSSTPQLGESPTNGYYKSAPAYGYKYVLTWTDDRLVNEPEYYKSFKQQRIRSSSWSPWSTTEPGNVEKKSKNQYTSTQFDGWTDWSTTKTNNYGEVSKKQQMEYPAELKYLQSDLGTVTYSASQKKFLITLPHGVNTVNLRAASVGDKGKITGAITATGSGTGTVKLNSYKQSSSIVVTDTYNGTKQSTSYTIEFNVIDNIYVTNFPKAYGTSYTSIKNEQNAKYYSCTTSSNNKYVGSVCQDSYHLGHNNPGYNLFVGTPGWKTYNRRSSSYVDVKMRSGYKFKPAKFSYIGSWWGHQTSLYPTSVKVEGVSNGSYSNLFHENAGSASHERTMGPYNLSTTESYEALRITMYKSGNSEIMMAMATFDGYIYPDFNLMTVDDSLARSWRGPNVTAVNSPKWSDCPSNYCSSGLKQRYVYSYPYVTLSKNPITQSNNYRDCPTGGCPKSTTYPNSGAIVATRIVWSQKNWGSFGAWTDCRNNVCSKNTSDYTITVETRTAYALPATWSAESGWRSSGPYPKSIDQAPIVRTASYLPESWNVGTGWRDDTAYQKSMNIKPVTRIMERGLTWSEYGPWKDCVNGVCPGDTENKKHEEKTQYRYPLWSSWSGWVICSSNGCPVDTTTSDTETKSMYTDVGNIGPWVDCVAGKCPTNTESKVYTTRKMYRYRDLISYDVTEISCRANKNIYPPVVDFDYTITDVGEVTITGYLSESSSVTIPNTIEGKVVTSIGYRAFFNKNINSVNFNEGLESIGAYAFADNFLTGVSFGSKVKEIGHAAFYNNALSNISINEGLETIGTEAFKAQAIQYTGGVYVYGVADRFDSKWSLIFDQMLERR